MKQYRITISEETIPEGPNGKFHWMKVDKREHDVFQYLVHEKDIDIKKVLRTIVEVPSVK